MTPRSQSSSAVHGSNLTDADTTTTKHNDSVSEHEEETRPRHTAEIGTLKKLSVGGTAWLGSSSGVYFVNTVRTAFSAAFASQTPDADGNVGDDSLPASEDIITGEDAEGRNVNGNPLIHNTSGSRGSRALQQHDDFHRRIVAAVGYPPTDRNLAMDLVTTFFRQTHPLFPFLHGPEFLNDVKVIYSAMTQPMNTQPYRAKDTTSGKTNAKPHGRRSNSDSSVLSEKSASLLDNLRVVDPLKLITFQIVINIAALSHSSAKQIASLPISSTIHSAQALMTLILPLSTTPLLTTIQLLFAAELYLCSTISLRHSSTIAGLVLRLIYHTGLHRCPLRYAALTEQDCEIRKRVFWSAYALDRHLSLALGDPNTFQDSDIDVCLSRNGGEGELHKPVARDLLCDVERQNELPLHYPRDSSGRLVLGGRMQRPGAKSSRSMDETLADNEDRDRSETDTSSRIKQLREAALTAYVHYGKLTGRIIEIFHKSINFRFPKEDAIGFLTADIENWWNDLPPTLTGDSGSGANLDEFAGIDPGLIERHRLLTPFFTLLYHQLLLLLNRPRLSLDQSTAEFQQGLQVCIRASRSTLTALKRHKENCQSMFLPGLLSAAWMSGLIIAFACQLGKYPKMRACSDIKSCLTIIESMNMKWYTVKNCHKVLTLLLSNINGRRATSTGYLPAARNEQTSRSYDSITIPTTSRKRTLDLSAESGEYEHSPKRASVTSASPQSSDFTSPPARTREMRPISTQQQNYNPTTLQQQDSTMSNTSMRSDATVKQLYPSVEYNALSQAAQGGFAGSSFPTQQRAGAAVYADPQDMAFAQSSHSMGLPELSGMEDQMFWGNLDSNMFDVFGAVSWENMTGPIGPMANAYDVSSFANMTNDNPNMNQQRFQP